MIQTSTHSNSNESVSGYCIGAIGRLVELHALVYHELCEFDSRFEIFVAREIADFIENFDPACDGLWLYKRGDEIIGSIAIDGHDKDLKGARLRFLIVDPRCHNQGIGSKLMAESIQFCKQQSMSKIYLWTTQALVDAKRLYEKFGFSLVEQIPHDDWGNATVHERFELLLID
jgi:N-acetylglutamate synthase-like GNAT family acetyltransferase